MPRTPTPKNVAKYQNSEQFSGRPDVADARDRVKHREKADPEEFAKTTAHENERNISQPPTGTKPPEKAKPDQPVSESPTRKTDEDVGGF